jgi:hypothetical protein
MELTPEERKRIYLEEKARLDAREQLQQESKKPKTTRRQGMKWVIFIFFCFVLFGMLAENKSPKSTVTPKTPAQLLEEAKAQQKQNNSCTTKLQKAKELDMLYDITVREGTVKVLVGPAYFSVPIDAKQGFAEVINCVVMQGKGGGIPFDLFHWQTGID